MSTNTKGAQPRSNATAGLPSLTAAGLSIATALRWRRGNDDHPTVFGGDVISVEGRAIQGDHLAFHGREEIVDRFEEGDRRRPIVHWHGPRWGEQLDQLRGRAAVDGGPPADRNEQQVDFADRLQLLRPQLRLAEIAHVAHAK